MSSATTMKTSIELALGTDAGKCTIKVPMSAFENDEEQVAAFTSKITAAVLKVAREATATKQSKEQAMEPEQASSSDDITDLSRPILFSLVYEGRMKRTTRLRRALKVFANQRALSVECFSMYGDFGRIGDLDTADSVSLEEKTFAAPVIESMLIATDWVGRRRCPRGVQRSLRW